MNAFVNGEGRRAIKVFVIMPFGNKGEYRDGQKESDHVFGQIIRPAVLQAVSALGDGLVAEINREVDRNQSGSITESILHDLVTADVVIADLSGNNANVFLELGVRFSLRRKVTILLAQANTIIPFDVQDYRVVKYDPLVVPAACEALAHFVQRGLSEKVGHDSLVFRTFPKLSVRIPLVLDVSFDPSVDAEMPWDEFMNRIEWLGGQFEHAVNNGTFAPDALVGISNGGLILADILGRNYLRGTPILSLWAQRFKRETDHRSWYFKNPFNDALMNALRDSIGAHRQDNPPKILLVDDRVGSGQTAQQAIDYLRETLGDSVQLVFVPLAISRPEYIETVRSVLPCNVLDKQSGRRVVTLSESLFLERLVTSATKFPYKKAIAESAGAPA